MLSTSSTPISEPVSNQTMLVDEYYASVPASVHGLAGVVRGFIRHFIATTLPEMNEELKYGLPFYTYKGMVCFVNPKATHIDLAFTDGRIMSDTFGLFDERGLKRVRHIRIESEAFVREYHDEIMNYLIEATVLNDRRYAERGSGKRKRFSA
jgi:hypothetical protein